MQIEPSASAFAKCYARGEAQVVWSTLFTPSAEEWVAAGAAVSLRAGNLTFPPTILTNLPACSDRIARACVESGEWDRIPPDE